MNLFHQHVPARASYLALTVAFIFTVSILSIGLEEIVPSLNNEAEVAAVFSYTSTRSVVVSPIVKYATITAVKNDTATTPKVALAFYGNKDGRAVTLGKLNFDTSIITSSNGTLSTYVYYLERFPNGSYNATGVLTEVRNPLKFRLTGVTSSDTSPAQTSATLFAQYYPGVYYPSGKKPEGPVAAVNNKIPLSTDSTLRALNTTESVSPSASPSPSATPIPTQTTTPTPTNRPTVTSTPKPTVKPPTPTPTPNCATAQEIADKYQQCIADYCKKVDQYCDKVTRPPFKADVKNKDKECDKLIQDYNNTGADAKTCPKSEATMVSAASSANACADKATNKSKCKYMDTF